MIRQNHLLTAEYPDSIAACAAVQSEKGTYITVKHASYCDRRVEYGYSLTNWRHFIVLLQCYNKPLVLPSLPNYRQAILHNGNGRLREVKFYKNA